MTDKDNLIVAERPDGTDENEWEVVDHNDRRSFLRTHGSNLIESGVPVILAAREKSYNP
jgi:hypothetical protein